MKKTILLALAWAAAIIGVAIAGKANAIPESSADTLFIVLPILAVMSLGAISPKSGCGLRA